MTGRDTRQALLDAAVSVTREHGLPGLTLDAVAARAGVSKGGLLYHFATKEELIRVLVVDALDAFEADVLAQSDDGWTEGYVRACAAGDEALSEGRAVVGLLAALAGDPANRAAVAHRAAAWQDRISREARDPVDATIVRLAADGLWYASVLGEAPPTSALRRAVVQRLIEMARTVPAEAPRNVSAAGRKSTAPPPSTPVLDTDCAPDAGTRKDSSAPERAMPANDS